MGQGLHPRAHAPGTLLVMALLSAAGAVVGLQMLTTLGITPNTSLIGVLLAIALSRIPLRSLRAFRSIHVQNLVQTNISSATFGAANSLLLPIGVPALMGRPDLVNPMLVGAALGMLIDLAMLYWLFDSRLFPGSSAWPHGLAAAEAIMAGDQGGRRAALLGAGATCGAAGSLGLGVLAPLAGSAAVMSAFGVAFIGNVWALSMFGLGLLASAYAPTVAGVNLAARHVPHGLMIGAGLAALLQAITVVARAQRRAAGADVAPPTRSVSDVRRALAMGLGLYVAAALVLAGLAGFWTEMSARQLAGWVAFAAVASIAAELIVGFSAMHAGWFPAFSTALIFLMLGLSIGFPPHAAALLVGFVASGGPAFADAGYDLKAGWQLRGQGRERALELDGRRQQIIAGLIGLVVATAVVFMAHDRYFSHGLFPPIDRVYVATIETGMPASLLRDVSVWVALGAAIQLAGGADRQMGILLATGLLLGNAAAGWAVLLGIAIRASLKATHGPTVEPAMAIFGAGCVAGDALAGFASSMTRLRWR